MKNAVKLAKDLFMKIPKDLQNRYVAHPSKTSKKQISSFQRTVEHITSSSVPAFFNKHVSENTASTESLKGRVSYNPPKKNNN